MIDIVPISFNGIEDIEYNSILYKEKFIKDAVMVFRNANLSHENHIKINDVFSKILGCHRENNVNGYTENHSRMTENKKHQVGSDDIMLTWHIEHPHYENPIVLGTWNMHKFTTDEENGKTYFVDTETLFNMMPKNMQDFSFNCKIINPVGETQGLSGIHNLIENHWITNKPLIRISHLYQTGKDYQVLHSFENRIPTSFEYEEYNNVISWIQNQISKNLDIRMVHRWNQGDLAVTDMYKMCHAVSGGFESKDREFTGIWARQYKNDIRKG